MKIVFWSEEAACGTTSNMIATASMIAAKHNCRIAMLSAEKNVHDLAGNFARPDSATVNEECSYYVLEGLDYLLMAGKYGSLTEHHLEELYSRLWMENFSAFRKGSVCSAIFIRRRQEMF